MLHSKLFFAALGMTLCSLTSIPSTAQAQPVKQKWTSSTGSAIDAEFIRLAEGAVIVKKDGKEISVPLAKLSIDSHLQALKLANPNAFSKPAPKATIGIEQTAESTKLLNESPFTENQTIEQYLDTLATEIEAGNATAMWHMLTPEMQADVEDVVLSAVEVGGKGMLVQIRALMKHLATIVKEKKAFIFASPLASANPKATREMQLGWPQFEVFVEALTEKTNWDSANFTAGNVGPWMAALTAKLGKASVTMNQMAAKAGLPVPDVKQVFAYKIVSQSADSAVVQFTYTPPPQMNPQTRQMMQPKAPEPVEWVRVSGKWLPKSMVDNWKDGVAISKSQMDLVIPGVTQGLGFVIPLVGSLANAKTQQEFNAALQAIMAPLAGRGGANGLAGMDGSSSMGSGSSMMGSGSSMGSGSMGSTPMGSSGGSSMDMGSSGSGSGSGSSMGSQPGGSSGGPRPGRPAGSSGGSGSSLPGGK